MRVAVTGYEGQVVRALAEHATLAGDIQLVRIGRPSLDLSSEPQAIIRALKGTAPDAIVSAAAYTSVDLAEAEPEVAFSINERGAGAVAEAAARLRVTLIHLSTDYVFDGLKKTPYVEEDETRPTTIYGKSKLAGERAVLATSDNAAILRTAWVYSPFGSNFVKTMLRLGEARDHVRVVADQYGNPTSASDVAEAILLIIRNLLNSAERPMRGIFHLTGEEDANWATFAKAIFAESARRGGASAIVEEIATADFPTPAKRPINSRLDGSKLAQIHQVRLPSWRQSLPSVLERLLNGH